MPLDPIVRFGCGAALLSAAVLAAGLAGVAWPPVLLALAFACIWLFRRGPGLDWHTAHLPLPAKAAALLYTVLYLFYALSPEIQSDALHYHYTLPEAFRQTGRFPARISFYDVLPQGMETLFATAYGLGGDAAAKLTHLLFLLLTVPLIVQIAVSLGISASTGWLAGLFYALTPVTGISGTCGYTDAAMVFFTLLVFHLLRQPPSPTQALAVGLAAGFCYAIKFTGGIVTAAAFVWLLIQHRGRHWTRFTAGAALMVLPWILRAWVLTGNPFAPLLNALFPNEYFHIETERNLAQYLRNYGEVEWATIPLELTFYGDLLQGLLGPAWLLLPIALLSLRKRLGWYLLAASLVSGGMWFLNIGARFLMPALPFLALALFQTLPRPAALGVLLTHAVLSWPGILSLYTPNGSWVLDKEIPWRVALGFESRQQFRLRKSFEHNYAALIQRHVPPTDKVLDLANAPAAITHAQLVNAWQSALGDRLVRSLQLGATPDRGALVSWQVHLPATPISAVRLRWPQPAASSISLAEVRLWDPEDKRLQPNVLWSTTAWPNVWESNLAVDNNATTGWNTWQPVQPGMFWEVDFSGPRAIRRIEILGHKSLTIPPDLFVRTANGWTQLALPPSAWPLPGLNLRRTAIQAVRREAIRYILAPAGTDAFGRIGQDMKNNPSDWDLTPLGYYDTVTLFRLR